LLGKTSYFIFLLGKTSYFIFLLGKTSYFIFLLGKTSYFIFFSHSYRASWYYKSFNYSPTDTLLRCLKKY